MPNRNYYHQFIVWVLFAFLIFGCLLRVGAASSNEISPPGLIAIIKSNSGEPKKYIRVEINGPEYKKIATNHDGIIATKLRSGQYSILIRERSRQKIFKITIKNDEITEETIVLPW